MRFAARRYCTVHPPASSPAARIVAFTMKNGLAAFGPSVS
jgi:hypothetical protein